LRFLVDAQLPPALAAWLRSKGHEAHHVVDVGRGDMPDDAIWTLAIAEGSMIVTKDRDFVDWALARAPKARILWVRFGNIRRDVLIARFEAAWPRLEDALDSDATVIEVGR
jgi:predicted nuclease of predicted toxin-antitoxin system